MLVGLKLEGESGYVFFFQAEDGIRARNVTGVQTCALPIWWKPPATKWMCLLILLAASTIASIPGCEQATTSTIPSGVRSEERRVGKEGRCGWGACHEGKRGHGRRAVWSKRADEERGGLSER